MKKTLCMLLILLITVLTGCSAVAPSSEIEVMDFNKHLTLKKPNQPINQAPAVLFLGNSFIFVNDMPAMFEQLSNSGGFSPEVYELSDGGYKLENFADESDELGFEAYQALKEYEWDYVVLQEQSRLPTLMAEEMMYPAARTLDALIKEANAQTTFLMTWAYKEGDDFDLLGKKYKSTRDQMQTQLADSYIKISDELDALLAPAGIAFIKCANKYPDIELWDEDLQHPSQAGTYLSACVLYATLYDQSPVGLKFTAELDAQTAASLQQVAQDVVLA
ncbi:DUF4886 domain-containing protein [Oscillospiraceae bacterium PP1C4]